MIKGMRGGVPNLYKKGTQEYEGKSQLIQNINTIKSLSALVKTSFGPHGMKKLIINHLDKIFITNDVITMLNELDIAHPLSKLIVFSALQQQREIGDGCNYVIMFAGELMSKAEKLLNMGLPITTIINGFIVSLYQVYNVIFPTISSKQFEIAPLITSLVTRAVLAGYRNKQFLVDSVQICKIANGSINDSNVFLNTLITPRNTETSCNSATNCKCLIFSAAIDLAQSETKGTVLIQNSEQLFNYNSSEAALLESYVKHLSDLKVKVLIGSSIGEMALFFMNKYGMIGIKIQSKYELRRMAQLASCHLLPVFGKVTEEQCGFLTDIHIEEFGNHYYTFIKNDNTKESISTILLRGSTSNYLSDIEKSVEKGINTYRVLLKDPRMVYSAGATEIAMAYYLAEYSNSITGIEQYAVKMYAQSFEVFVKVMCDNNGINASDAISSLYKSVISGKKDFGIDVNNGEAAPITIYDLVLTKMNAIKLATLAAVTALRIDKMVMSKPAGGPKVGGRGGHWDDED